MSQEDKISFKIVTIDKPYFLNIQDNNWGSLNAYAKQHKLTGGEDCSHAVTHCRIDGGKFCFDTDDLLEEFYKLYADDMDSGVMHYCHENRSELFPLFFDLDLLLTTQVVEDRLLEWAMLVHRGVRQFLKPDMKAAHDACFVSVAPYTRKDGNWKTGLHMNYPEVMVDVKWAYEITAAVSVYINRKTGGKPPEFMYDWYPKVLDCQPIERGLRMIGSRKADVCGVCKKKTPNCVVPECKRGHIDRGRPYWPRWLIGTDTSVDSFKKSVDSTYSLVKLCSTRLPKSRQFAPTELRRFLCRPHWWLQTRDMPTVIGQEKYQQLVNAKSNKKRSATNNTEKKKRRRQVIRTEDVSDNGSTMHGVIDGDAEGGFIKLDEDSREYGIIKDYFEGAGLSAFKKKKQFHVLKDGYVTGVSKTKSGSVYCVWTSSKQCKNLIPNSDGTARDHSSQTVWVKITSKGVQWRCHCKCPTKENRINNIPCAKPTLWSRTNHKEFMMLKSLPIELFGLFENSGGAFAEMRRVCDMTKRGILKTTRKERLEIIQPTVDSLTKQLKEMVDAKKGGMENLDV